MSREDDLLHTQAEKIASLSRLLSEKEVENAQLETRVAELEEAIEKITFLGQMDDTEDALDTAIAIANVARPTTAEE